MSPRVVTAPATPSQPVFGIGWSCLAASLVATSPTLRRLAPTPDAPPAMRRPMRSRMACSEGGGAANAIEAGQVPHHVGPGAAALVKRHFEGGGRLSYRLAVTHPWRLAPALVASRPRQHGNALTPGHRSLEQLRPSS